MSSRSEKDRYLPDTGASSIGGIPPAWRNQRDPTGPDTPHATAASSLVSPRAICTQNARSRSRRTGGRPGDSITARGVNAAAQPGGRPIESTSIVEVLRPPVEPGQYTSVAFTQRLIDEGVDPSVGSVGDALDNALAETTVGSFKNELIRRQGPWRDVNHVELATAEWVQWFNTERPHEYLDDFTPEAVERLHYDHRRTPPKAG
jgi:transposase InsO family protein